MVSSDDTSGLTDRDNGEGISKSPPKRREHSIDNISDFTLHIQYEVLQILELSDDWESSADFLVEFGGALRKIIDTFEAVSGKRPTVHDVIWCLGFDLHVNPREKRKKWSSAA